MSVPNFARSDGTGEPVSRLSRTLRIAGTVWHRSIRRPHLALPLLVVLLAAQAEVPGPPMALGFGQLSAIAAGDAGPLPRQVVLEAGRGDFGDVAQPRLDAVREALRAALEQRGIAVVESGAPVLQFHVWSQILGSAPPEADPDRPLPSPARIQRRIESHPTIPLGDSRVLPLPKATVPLGREREEVVSHLAISFFLFEPGQEPDWSATIEATGEVAEATDLLRRLARAAMDTLGASAEREFVLSCQDDVDEEGGLCLP